MPLHQKRFAMQTPVLFSNRLVALMKKSAQLLLEDPGGLQLDLFWANVQLPFKSSNRSNTGHPNGTSQTARESGMNAMLLRMSASDKNPSSLALFLTRSECWRHFHVLFDIGQGLSPGENTRVIDGRWSRWLVI